MSMLDPFNPRPGSMPGDPEHEQRRRIEQSSGKSAIWVPVVIVGGIGLLIAIASL